jgi:hypothetical protein
MGKDEMPATPILPVAGTLPNPLYVVFCRLVFDQAVANDELAAMQQVLFEAADEAAANPRFQTLPGPAPSRQCADGGAECDGQGEGEGRALGDRDCRW